MDHTSFYRIIYFMSLDEASCHCNVSFCQKTTFVLLNLNSCHWIVDHSIELYTSCHRIELHVIGSETSFHRASGLLKKVCFPECFSRYVTANMAAHLQGQHRTAQELIESNIKTVLLDVMNKLACNADLDYGLYKVEWLCSLVLRLGGTFEAALLPKLRQAHDLISLMISRNEESSHVHNNRPMIVTGNKGRPKIYISRNQLEYFLEKGFKGSDIARMLSVSNKTIYRRLQEFELPVRASYSDISEADLDVIILDILHNFPNCGYKSMRGHLLCKGHKVQGERIREAMRRVDPEGNAYVVVHYMQVDRGSFI